MASLEEEAKRVIPAIKNRQSLMKRQWDGVPATAAAFGLKGQDKLFNAVVKAVEKGCGGPGTLQALRRLKVDYKASDGEGNEVAKTAMMSVMTHADPGYEGFMDAACEQAVIWLHEAQKAHAREKGVAAPAQAEFTQPAFWGRAGGTKAAFKTAVWSFLENALDPSLSSALQAEATQAWKTQEAYLAQAEKKKNTAMDHDVLRKLIKDLEDAYCVHLHLWAVPSLIDMGRLQVTVEAMQLPTHPKTEPENLKPFADKEGRIRTEDKTETWEFSEESGPQKIVESRDKVKVGAAGTVLEEYEGVRLLLTGLLLLGQATTVDRAKVPVERGGGQKLITPTQVYCFLEMLHVCAHMFPGGAHGAKQLYTIRAQVFREMKDLVNAAPYATYDYAVRVGREKLWKAVVLLQDTKTLLSISETTPSLGDSAPLAQDSGASEAKKDSKVKGAGEPAPATAGAVAASGNSATQLEKLNEELKRKKEKIAELEKAIGERNATIKKKDTEIQRLQNELNYQKRNRNGGDRSGNYRRRSRSPSQDNRDRRRRR